MRLLLASALAVWASLVFAQTLPVEPEAPEITKAKSELVRLEQLVEAGGVPRNRLEQARQELSEAMDRAVLRRTLYGSLKVEDLTEPLAKQMLDSAQRLVSNQQKKVNQHRELVEQNVVGRLTLTPFIEELDIRRKSLALAESRVMFWNQLLEMARAEQARQLEQEQLAAAQQLSDDESTAVLALSRVRQLENEFERVFSRSLPVSARGDTTFHRTLGFNHTGRIDVALNPDSAEGQWLRKWLDRSGIPYLAFRGAVPGQASAAHIHVGPPSTRLRSAD
jgi:hypothetical protein